MARGESGAIAQLGERLLCKQEVAGSIPAGSTNSFARIQARSHTCIAVRCICGFVRTPCEFDRSLKIRKLF
jgi:hypothetical protein